jgi:hypothetical protein
MKTKLGKISDLILAAMAFLWSLSVPVLRPVGVVPLPADVPLLLGPFVPLCCCLQKMEMRWRFPVGFSLVQLHNFCVQSA